MFLLAPIALALATVPLLGGRLAALAELRFRLPWALPAALGTQVLVISVWPTGPEWLLKALHIASYLLAALFVVANRSIPGIKLIALGGALNFLTITANGGVMPASHEALAGAGLLGTSGSFQNSEFVADARLGFLGDVFFIPEGWPLANVFSIGDVLVALGVVYGIHRICGSKLVSRPPVPMAD